MKREAKKAAASQRNRIALKGGAYSLIISGVVLALLLALNLMVSTLPTPMTKYDISSAKLYSVTSNTMAVLNALEDDVSIYWVTQADKEDEIIENLLGKYASLSDHIEVVKKNPDIFPTFAEQYTDAEVPNNSLIVECGSNSRFVSFDDIYVKDYDLYSNSYAVSGFDGEGAITSAIDYVTCSELPKLYTLEGHGETALPSTFADQVDKANLEVSSLSLLSSDGIPEDAACVMIHAPASDISTEDQKVLLDYVENGGRLLVIAGPTESGILPNLCGLLTAYGVEPVDGVVVDADRDHYALRQPVFLLPELNSHPITDPLIEENYAVVLPISQGMIVRNSTKAQTTALLNTSEQSYSKTAGYAMSSYEKEDGDTDGPLALAVSVETAQGGGIVWIGCSQFLDDMYNAYSSGANDNLAMNALSALIGERDAVAIRSKSLNYSFLTISETTASTLKLIMICVFPLVYLAIGAVVVLRRRKVQNETL